MKKFHAKSATLDDENRHKTLAQNDCEVPLEILVVGTPFLWPINSTERVKVVMLLAEAVNQINDGNS